MDNIKHKNISVNYKLYILDGDKEHLVEATEADQPFNFMSGMGVTLKDFEDAIEPLAVGDDFDFTIPKDKAYGEYETERVIDVDKSIFTINNHFDHEHIFEGAIVPLQNADGNRFLSKVVEIKEDKVVVDLNHPLAGKDLHFCGKVVSSVEVSDEEFQDYINRMNSHECGCGCGDCEGGCGGHDHEGGCGGHHHEGGCKGHGEGGHKHGEGCCGHHGEGEHKHGGCCGHHH
jgi:FKBP-type peptidyl-prolyl cis-trans isomerase SlyD